MTDLLKYKIAQVLDGATVLCKYCEWNKTHIIDDYPRERRKDGLLCHRVPYDAGEKMSLEVCIEPERRY